METHPTLEEVRHFLSTIQLPEGPFELDRGTRIVGVKKFVDLEFGVIDAGSVRQLQIGYISSTIY
ncbi:DUF6965 family protein [Puia dinghuensis]|uniref:DUF6965 domain-containing protein n=1 Tax=Puia dinghuensis TaxID=1792502 RepID=A0A8J2UBW3_9BACT|nr:hypothetical protein [Puia dinghuensis]GGA93082.1 hypothetical protein GCM10011511_15610 [Puia dinghuensis]